MKRHFSCLIPMALALLAGSPAAVSVEMVLALDRSGSMKLNDPNRDSIRGVELFSELLDSGDGLAFLSFAKRAETLLPMTRLEDAKTRRRLADAAKTIRMNGTLTDFGAALRAAYGIHAGRDPEPGVERSVVLFTDGRIDLGNPAANQAELTAIANELLPKFKAGGIRIYGVAFSPKADLEFLRGVAEATGGQAFLAERPADIYQSFVRLFEEADQPLTAPIENGRVRVDANVQELKLLVGRDSAGEAIRITDPQGKEIRELDHNAGVEWKRAPQFDRITIKQPRAGSWTVMGASGEKKAYLASDLDLNTGLPASVHAGETVVVTAELSYQGMPVVDPAMLKDAHFKATVFGGLGVIQREIELKPQAAGIPGGTLVFPEAGDYRVRISAESSGFQRHKEYSVTVNPALPATMPEASTAARIAKPAPEAQQKPAEPPPALSEAKPPAAARVEDLHKRSALATLIWINVTFFGLLGLAIGLWCCRKHREFPSEPEAGGSGECARRRV